MKHCIQSTTIDRQGQAAPWVIAVPAMAAVLGESAALRVAQRSGLRRDARRYCWNDPTAILDPVSNYLAGMTRGLRAGVDSARRCCRCNPLWIT
jgi:hypothetical protein